MAKKYKVTGCARLFIILIILAPLTYIGASYINGEDGIENFKKLLRLDGISTRKASDTSSDTGDSKEVYRLKQKIERLEDANKELKEQVDYYKDKLDKLNQGE